MPIQPPVPSACTSAAGPSTLACTVGASDAPVTLTSAVDPVTNSGREERSSILRSAAAAALVTNARTAATPWNTQRNWRLLVEAVEQRGRQVALRKRRNDHHDGLAGHIRAPADLDCRHHRGAR